MADKNVCCRRRFRYDGCESHTYQSKWIDCSNKNRISVQYPQPGWAEQDPQVIHKHIVETIKKLLQDKPEYISQIARV